MIDIGKSANQDRDVSNNIIACHALSGYDTVAQLSGIAKTTVLKVLKTGKHNVDSFANTNSSTHELVQQATFF